MLKKITSYDERDLYLLSLPRLGHWHVWPDKKPYFRLTIFLDGEQIESDEVFLDFARSALNAGARSIMCAGTAAEKMHRLFDMLRINDQYEPEPEDFCMTNVAYENEPLDEILWESFFVGYSCDRFEECNPPVVVCLLDHDARITKVEKMSQSLRHTFEEVLSRE